VSAPALQGAIEQLGADAKTAEVPATRVTPMVLPVDLVQRLLERSARVRVAVRGRATHPALRSGDRVTLEASTRPPARGDLVALRTEEGLVVRRCIGRASEGRIVTAGDNGDGPGAPAPETALAGLVVAVERCGHRVDRDANRGVRLRRTAVGLARSCRENARELLGRLAG
jgi:hypothetical protein